MPAGIDDRSHPKLVVERFYIALRAHDRAAIIELFSDDATFCQHLPKSTLPYAGTTRGKNELASRLDQVYGDWEVLKVEPSRLFVDGAQVDCMIDIAFRLRRTGDVYDGSLRHVFDIVHGRIHRLDEYLDAAMLDAFLRLNGPL